MKIVIINPALYTSETPNIKKVKSIKDSMIYNLCLEFKKQGHIPILIAAKDYEPIVKEKYDFDIVFLETKMKKIFKPNCFPYLKGLNNYLKKIEFDYIISGEVFSMNSLLVSRKYKNKTIIWHELAKHNNIFKKIPSLIWYNIIARIFFRNTRIVARSKNAQNFISKYCNNVSEQYIDHGVDLDTFSYSVEKNKQFIIVSQLIERKHVDGIIDAFKKFVDFHNDYKLIIIGSGSEEEKLKKQVLDLNINNFVAFLGQKTHKEIIPLLSKSCALVINTEKDNSMLSIVESIACCTPIITTDVPYNCDYIKSNELGIIMKKISCHDFEKIVSDLDFFVNNCVKYRYKVSNEYHVKQFLNELK